MRSILSALLLLMVAGVLVSCDSGNTGDFKIRLRLPIDINEVCSYYDDDPDGEDYTYCITNRDQILLEIYSKESDGEGNPIGEYAFVQSKLISVESSDGGKENFIRSLKEGNFYRFFVSVTNTNEKLKLTGGVDGVYYDDAKNYAVDLFLGATADFVRVVKDREKYEDTSLKTYFDSSGSRGAAAVALKGGLVYLSGGYSFDYEKVMPDTMVFDMQSLTSANEEKLRTPLEYHAAALLDDGSRYGKAVVAFGTSDDGSYSSSILLFDPEKGRYTTLGTRENGTKAKAITIDGKVYIAGGCNENSASPKIYVVDNTSPLYTTTEFASMKTARCNHAIADVSTVDENGIVTPRILIIGGSSDIDGKNPITGDNIVELAVAGSSKPLPLKDRKGEDSVDLTKNGLVSPAAATFKMDDLDEMQKVVAVVGGSLKDSSDDNENAALVLNKNFYVLSENSDSITYDVNSAPSCARPSMATIGTTEKSPAQYAALNCGTPNLETGSKATETQNIFVVQVKRSFDNELSMNVMSASVKESLMENRDPENGVILDGPTTVNALGQAFVFGTEYVYQISGTSIPY